MTDPRSGPHAPPAVSQEEVLAMLSGMTQELAGLHSAAVKYTTLKRLLADVAGRLPGIRDIAKPLALSPVTAQRAVAELTEEGVLYSRPRSGVFVSGKGAAPASPGAPAAASAAPAAGSLHPFRATFRFATDSAAPYQRKFWEEAAARFAAQHPNVAPQLQFEAAVSFLREDAPEAGTLADACECYDRSEAQREKEAVLDLAAFSWEPLPVAPVRGRLLPLYYRTYFLFSNRTLLDRHGLPHPDYRTFAGQEAYLAGVGPRFAALGHEPRPYSIQEPVTLLGSRAGDFAALLRDEEPDDAKKEAFAAVLERLLAFCRRLRYAIGDREGLMESRNAFLKGKEPFFLGYSVDFWEFSQRKLPFQLGAYPSLCCDDAPFLWPRVGAVAGHSEHPVESLAFLRFLLEPESQRRFAATGNFGATLAPEFHPPMAADPAWIAGALRDAVPFRFATREDYYLALHVLGGAVWRNLVESAKEPVPAAATLEQALQLGRSYLRHRSDRGGG
ncbi:MAG TPA: extracellular solute-binding protein [Candidatus Methylacidiphilales bacterium]